MIPFSRLAASAIFALWLAFILAIVASLPGTPPQLRSDIEHILSGLPGAGVPSGPSPATAGSGSQPQTGTAGSLPQPSGGNSGPYTSKSINPGTIPWCASVSPFVELFVRASSLCWTAQSPSPTETEIAGVVQFIDPAGSLVSDEGAAGSYTLATAAKIAGEPQSKSGVSDLVYYEAEDLVAQGKGSWVAQLVKIGKVGTGISIVFVAYQGYEDASQGNYVGTASVATGYVAGYVAVDLAVDAAICGVGVLTGPGDIVICGAVFFLADTAASTAVTCALQPTSCPTASSASALESPTLDCTFPCSSSSSSPPIPSIIAVNAPFTNCLLSGASGCIISNPSGPPGYLPKYDCTFPCSSSGSTSVDPFLNAALGR